MTSVAAGSPAAGAGLQPGDRILGWKGVGIDDLETFRAFSSAIVAGQAFSIRLHRGTVTLVPTVLTPERAREILAIRLGVTIDLASRHRQRLGPGFTSGVVILSLTPKALADQAQLRVGDVIERLGGHPTRDLAELGIAAARTAHVQTVPVVFRRGKDHYRTSYENR